VNGKASFFVFKDIEVLEISKRLLRALSFNTKIGEVSS